ncbi:MAG: esterase YqiA [Gammaproteobacteria bacterium]|nr:esterase YqiA [Gammaproteobacteria bacterium]
MPTLLYIHGFLSSPQSVKAVQMKNWLEMHRPDITFTCPFLTPYPDETRSTLENIIEHSLSGPDGIAYVMGSSLGGFWATWLVEKYNIKAVLINPAVKLTLFNEGYINEPLKNYHTDDMYRLTEPDIDEFHRLNLETISRPENYFIMLQTGDEVLDYQLAVKKYAGSKLLVEEGGDHSFINFESKIPQAVEFLET